MIRRHLTWLALITSAALGLWQLAIQAPVAPPIALGLFLVILGVVAGLRWGADSVAQLIKEMARLNRYLAKQNEELVELNQLHMKLLLAQEEQEEEVTHSVKTET